MPQRQLTGTRIRERRIDLGLRQADLASQAGISASYLNLIEHNRRRIGGKILHDLARALSVDASTLSEGTEKVVLDQLRSAALEQTEIEVELDRTEEFAGRTPGWAALVLAQARRIEWLEDRVQALTDRLAHDPQLAASLHDVITAVTSIRSTSSILVGDEEIDRDWQNRFHRNIYEDSQRLADSSRSLVQYLDAPSEDGGALLSPNEEIEAEIEKNPDLLFALVTGKRPDIPQLRSSAAQTLMDGIFERFASDIEKLPHGAFERIAREQNYEPEQIALHFGTQIDVVLRRLALLRVEDGHPATALAICDRSGVLTFLRNGAAFGLSRTGFPCPLWPLYQSLSQPMRPLRRKVMFQGNETQELLCYAVAVPTSPPSFDAPQLMEGVMLIMPQKVSLQRSQSKVGPGCRVCQRSGCIARREPSILSEIEELNQTF